MITELIQSLGRTRVSGHNLEVDRQFLCSNPVSVGQPQTTSWQQHRAGQLGQRRSIALVPHRRRLIPGL